MKFDGILQSTKTALTKHSPEILTGLGIAGMVTTTVLAVKATPKALQLIEAEQEKEDKSLTKLDYVRVAWKPYIPAIVTCSVSIACLIGASSVNLRRNAALATAYKLSETALTEYKEKVVETIGERKEKTVRDAIAKDKVEKNPVQNNNIIITGKGETLCMDAMGGRYFKSDRDKLERIENELNRRMRNEMYISLNEFYLEIGLGEVPVGHELGWHIDKGYIELSFSSQLTKDGDPCLVVDFYNPPIYGFRDI